MTEQDSAVLIIGGGSVGLSAALFLRMWGVPVILAERRSGLSPHPRAMGWSPRTMELYRAAGAAEAIEKKGRRRVGPPGRIHIESLAGKWGDELPWTPSGAEQSPDSAIEYSPYDMIAMPQDRLEPIIYGRAVELGADVRFGEECIGFEQRVDGVLTTLRRRDGSEYTLHTAYMIGADGDGGMVREALGIGRTGRGNLMTMRSLLFNADVGEELYAKVQAYRERGIVQYIANLPGFRCFFGGGDGDQRWLLMFMDDEDRDDAALMAAMKAVLGDDRIEPKLIATARWEATALIADRFADNRVFLAGDAAHALPPTRGGYGVNTGIEDAHNLAWKLAAVLSGKSTPHLLDSYDAERRPFIWLRYDQLFARPDYAMFDDGSAKADIIEDVAMDFGQLVRSDAILGAGPELPSAMRAELWAGQPGTRAQHLWITRNGQRVSTLDLFQRGWVLVAESAAWKGAAQRAAQTTGIALECVQDGTDIFPEDPDAIRAAFGLERGGASLIRPDGYIAWRTAGLPENPAEVLAKVIGHVASAAAS